MIFKNPAIRLSLALVLLTLNLLLVANFLGFIPDKSKTVLELRKRFCETLALQFTAAAEKKELQIIQSTLRAVVAKNDDILSAAIRTVDGQLIALAGDHLPHWKPLLDEKSTPTQLHVPVFRKNKQWASVEMRFTPIWKSNLGGSPANSFTGLLAFISLGGFICYFLVLRRTLRALDPSAVIPERVQNAFDILQEGILIIDKKEQIVMANKSFAGLFDKPSTAIVGLKGSELGWLNYRKSDEIRQLPWIQVLQTGKEQKSTSLGLIDSKGNRIKLIVNASCINDNAGRILGCIVTFDNVTQLEEKNFEMGLLVEKLQVSNKEIKEKSQELEFLANHDPLTLCLNRRALNRKFKSLFDEAKTNGKELSCLMTDIDFFKSVNDNYGHAAGDQVIRAVGDILKTCTRDEDLVGRYGGEEFCVVLEGAGIDVAAQIAERVRRTVEEEPCQGIKITVSLGVSTMEHQTGVIEDLIDQADNALYVAKESGRNRVICWEPNMAKNTETVAGDKAQGEKQTPHETKQTPTEIPALKRRVRELEALIENGNSNKDIHDEKTNLSGLFLFKNRVSHELARAKRSDQMLAIICISIDSIKRIYENLGYEKANKLLKVCEQRLKYTLRENIDMVAVTSGIGEESTVSMLHPTEFAILLADIKQVDHVTWIVKRMLDAFKKPFYDDVYIPAFFGISLFPQDGDTMESLYRSAANACSHVKRNNMKDRYCFSSDILNKKAAHQFRIGNLLHTAIMKKELKLHYQPKIETKTGQIAGFEALLRWQSAELGAVSPADFIPIAEHSGLIDKIGDWVLYNACHQLRLLLDEGLAIGSMAINISGVQLRERSLPDRIQKVLNKFKIDPKLLEIELTESALVTNKDKSIHVLEQIKKQGIRVTIDDFGTGFSSLSYLKNIPSSCIKIDRSFISDIGKDRNAEKLIASIISMAHSIGLDVVAEGVEEKHQADHLAALGCEYLQGYYFSHPVPGSKIPNFFKKTALEKVGLSLKEGCHV